MDILRKGRRIGGIVRSGNLAVLELPGVDELEREKACGPEALEVWDFRHPQNGLAGDHVAERINTLIYRFVGTWAASRVWNEGGLHEQQEICWRGDKILELS